MIKNKKHLKKDLENVLQTKIKTLVLIGSNGFTRRIKHDSKAEIPRTINIPFTYRFNLTDPTVAIYLNSMSHAQGIFVLKRLTKLTAFYELSDFKFMNSKCS